jgi:hypothetical protein
MLRVLVVTLIALAAGPSPAAAQTAVTTPAAPSLSPAEMEKFLLDGRVVKNVRVLKGVTDARQVTLSNGAVTHDAQIQTVDISKPLFEVAPKQTEINFRDCYCYNIAAYRLAVLLGLDNVPMSVKRVVEDKPAAVTWWLEEVMDEGDRRKEKLAHSNPLRAADYYGVMYVFDELIQNRDRNVGNMMWGRDSKMWMIDHTRAFRLGKDLRNPGNLTRIERSLFDKLRTLDRQAFADAVKTILNKDEIDALFIRRNRLVQLFDQRIASLGEAKVLYTIR